MTRDPRFETEQYNPESQMGKPGKTYNPGAIGPGRQAPEMPFAPTPVKGSMDGGFGTIGGAVGGAFSQPRPIDSQQWAGQIMPSPVLSTGPENGNFRPMPTDRPIQMPIMMPETPIGGPQKDPSALFQALMQRFGRAQQPPMGGQQQPFNPINLFARMRNKRRGF